MKNIIDLHDVQGVIMLNYAEYTYYKSRYLFLKVTNSDTGRDFVKAMLPHITSAAFAQNIKGFERKKLLPAVTTNISFTYNGLQELGIPTLTLKAFPDEFIMGIRNRASILGDNHGSSPQNWDNVYRDDIHIVLTINARNTNIIPGGESNIDSNMKEYYDSIAKIIDGHTGVTLLEGCKNEKIENAPYQDSSVIYEKINFSGAEIEVPTAKEHFGYTDGISNPYFKGMTPEMGSLLGGGKKINYKSSKIAANWAPIETGEFILGYRDEANEYPAAPIPKLFSKNGSFMVFNKFHENVGKFNEYLDKAEEKYKIGKEELAAKFVGRWRNGAPVTTFPSEKEADKISKARLSAIKKLGQADNQEQWDKAGAEYNEVNKDFIAFDYNNDINGSRCPIGAHTRRANPRGSLETIVTNDRKLVENAFATPAALDNRRRIIRRGLPYGSSTPESNNGEHGTIIITIVASIKRQFEFVIQQWMDYGNDFRLANDKDPIIGSQEEGGGRMVIEGDEQTPPKFIADLPRFIETRGGVYLFIPSISALNLIAEGIVDPT